MLNRFQGARGMLAGGAAAAGPVAERLNSGGCGPSGARQQMADPQSVRVRRMFGRTQPRVTENRGDASVLTWCDHMTTRGSVSSTDWQGGIT